MLIVYEVIYDERGDLGNEGLVKAVPGQTLKTRKILAFPQLSVIGMQA